MGFIRIAIFALLCGLFSLSTISRADQFSDLIECRDALYYILSSTSSSPKHHNRYDAPLANGEELKITLITEDTGQQGLLFKTQEKNGGGASHFLPTEKGYYKVFGPSYKKNGAWVEQTYYVDVKENGKMKISKKPLHEETAPEEVFVGTSKRRKSSMKQYCIDKGLELGLALGAGDKDRRKEEQKKCKKRVERSDKKLVSLRGNPTTKYGSLRGPSELSYISGTMYLKGKKGVDQGTWFVTDKSAYFVEESKYKFDGKPEPLAVFLDGKTNFIINCGKKAKCKKDGNINVVAGGESLSQSRCEKAFSDLEKEALKKIKTRCKLARVLDQTNSRNAEYVSAFKSKLLNQAAFVAIDMPDFNRTGGYYNESDAEVQQNRSMVKKGLKACQARGIMDRKVVNAYLYGSGYKKAPIANTSTKSVK